jgi:hypothetical protein
MSRWVLGLVAVLAVAPVAGADDAAAVVKKAIDAHGGAAVLDRLRAGTSKLKGDMVVQGTPLEFTGEVVYELPGKFRLRLDLEVGGQKLPVVQVVNGDTVSTTLNGTAQKLGDAERAELLQSLAMQEVTQFTPLLAGNKYTLRALPDEDVGGKPAAVVLVSAKNFKDTKLCFDKGTGLLVKTSRKALAPGNPVEVTEETVLSEYKKVDGIMTPMKMVVTHDGKKFMTEIITEAKMMEKADPKAFEGRD